MASGADDSGTLGVESNLSPPKAMLDPVLHHHHLFDASPAAAILTEELAKAAEFLSSLNQPDVHSDTIIRDSESNHDEDDDSSFEYPDNLNSPGRHLEDYEEEEGMLNESSYDSNQDSMSDDGSLMEELRNLGEYERNLDAHLHGIHLTNAPFSGKGRRARARRAREQRGRKIVFQEESIEADRGERPPKSHPQEHHRQKKSIQTKSDDAYKQRPRNGARRQGYHRKQNGRTDQSENTQLNNEQTMEIEHEPRPTTTTNKQLGLVTGKFEKETANRDNQRAPLSQPQSTRENFGQRGHGTQKMRRSNRDPHDNKKDPKREEKLINNNTVVPPPGEGKGRRARARRAKELKEKTNENNQKQGTGTVCGTV
eukprot:scaffold19042_cov53-Attheya_sp.AAC.6